MISCIIFYVVINRIYVWEGVSSFIAHCKWVGSLTYVYSFIKYHMGIYLLIKINVLQLYKVLPQSRTISRDSGYKTASPMAGSVSTENDQKVSILAILKCLLFNYINIYYYRI